MPHSDKSGSAFNIRKYALCLVLMAASLNFARGQQPPPASAQQPTATQQAPPTAPAPQAPLLPADSPDAVFRITTDLVQADVIVVDAQGRFVDNLQREQFELRVDDRPQPISVFERVRSGRADAGAQPAAARGGVDPPSSGERTVQPLNEGRTVLFFVDDFHLAHASLERARRVLTYFIDSEIAINDRAAIASTSGQAGFLQQLTSNKAVLRAAVARLHNRLPAATDVEIPRMTTHQAHVLEGGSDRGLLGFFVRETQRVHPFLLPEAAENIVLGRARQIVEQSAAITLETLSALEGLVRSVADLPGRKVAFFVSDGFLMNLRGSGTANRLRRIADAAARSRVAIYTLDARGLATLPSFDASRPAVFDPAGIVDRTNADELSASQEALFRLAADTGGRALINSNALVEAVPRALQETSLYYLLGWTPGPEERQNSRFHLIEVSIRGRPELIVRVPRGFYDVPPPTEAASATPSRRRRQSETPATPAASPAETALLSALHSIHPVTTLPASLSLGFVDMQDTGTVLTASTHLNATTLDFGPSDGDRRQAVVDIVSAVFNDQGQGVSSVKETLTISPPSTSSTKAVNDRVTYNHRFRLDPGIYQVRVAARDSRTGRAGSAMEWIEIPNLTDGPFSMSSLILGQRAEAASRLEAGATASVSPLEVNAGHRFGRAQPLRLLTYIYNAERSAAPPDVVLKIQVFRDDKPVIATPLSPLKTEGIEDLSRIPYLAELNTEGMPGGSYVLQVTAFDRTARANASQRASFEIE